MFNNKLTLLLLLIFQFMCAQAQIELTGGISPSFFLGDLGGKTTQGTNDFTDIDILSTRYALTGGVRAIVGGRIGLRANLIYARISGDDQYTTNTERRGRNLNFFSHILEGNALMELHLRRQYGGKTGSPGGLYLFGGIGVFHFEPKTRIDGDVVKLRPLGTEGQNYLPGVEPYKNIEMCIPFGLGYRWQLGNGGIFGVELNTRKTYTDYIDDVSTVYPDRNLLFNSSGALAVQATDRNISDIPGFSDEGAIRGNPNNNDTYFFFIFSYSHPLAGGGSGYGAGSGRKGGRGGIHGKKKCPTF